MITVLIILIILAAIALVIVVLAQKSKGGGLSSNFSSANSIVGVHTATSLVEKATWGLASVIIVLSIICVMIRPDARQNGYKSEVKAEQVVPATPDLNTDAPIAAPSQQDAQPIPGAPAK